MDFKKLLANVLFYFIKEAEDHVLMYSVDTVEWDMVFNNTINKMIELGLHDELNNDNIVERIYSFVMESDELRHFKDERHEYEEECAAYSRDPLAYVGLSQYDFI